MVVAAVGCGFESPDTSGADDASVPDDTPGGTNAACDLNKDFGAPTPIAELNSASDDRTPTLTPDGLTVYFASDRPGGSGRLDIYVATRASRTAPWGTPTPLPGVNTAGDESRPALTADGLSLYAEIRPTTQWSVAKATRASAQDRFGTLQPEPALNHEGFDSSPSVLPDASAIYYASERGETINIYRANRSSGVWAIPAVLTGADLNSSGQTEAYPLVSADDLTLYYASDRPTSPGGAFNLFIAKRASVTAPFKDPVPIAELNTNDDEIPGWISSDGCEIWFSRGTPPTRQIPYPDKIGVYDIYMARRPR
jgi:hypothetical protein